MNFLVFQYVHKWGNEKSKKGLERVGVSFRGRGREGEGKLTGILYAYDLVLCGDSKEDLRVILKGRFVEV